MTLLIIDLSVHAVSVHRVVIAVSHKLAYIDPPSFAANRLLTFLASPHERVSQQR